MYSTVRARINRRICIRGVECTQAGGFWSLGLEPSTIRGGPLVPGASLSRPNGFIKTLLWAAPHSRLALEAPCGRTGALLRREWDDVVGLPKRCSALAGRPHLSRYPEEVLRLSRRNTVLAGFVRRTPWSLTQARRHAAPPVKRSLFIWVVHARLKRSLPAPP